MGTNQRTAPNDPLDKFKAIYNNFSDIAVNRGRITEADTRANVLDRLIHEVLEWPREAVSRERYSKAGFLDYEFSRGVPILVLEAKAEGETFVVPHRKQSAPQKLKISGTLSSDKPTVAALEQVQSYCNERGVRYAVASNGYSFLLFRAITEGTSWRDGECLVFAGPKVIESNFTQFWNLLSYEAVKDGKLDDAFRLVSAESRQFIRPIQGIVDTDATYARNSLNLELRPYVDRFFGDIAKQSTIEVLKHCYVHSKPVQVIDSDLGLVIRDLIPRFAANAMQIRTFVDAEGGNFTEELRAKLDAARGTGSVVVIIGGIGSGKTTFLRRFFSVVAPELVATNGPVLRLHLDFLGAPDRVDDLDAFVWRSLSEALRARLPDLAKRETLEIIFSPQLSILKTVFGATSTHFESRCNEELFKLATDPKAFCLACLRYVCTLQRLPMIVLDNVDQLGNDIQAHIFTTAEYFANHLGCFSILVLREETYAAAQMQKQLTAYTIKPYHLSSPSFRLMIQLRIDYATNDASKAQTTQHHEQTSQEILEFFHLLRSSVFGKNHNIMRLLEAVSFGNMRFALDMFNSFITSGATNMPKILDKFRHGGYNVPFHEFAKSVILGDYRFYKESRSPIMNVFNCTTCRNSSHFTTLRLLSYLVSSGEGNKNGDGFVDLNPLVTAFIDVFDNEDDCLRSIEKAIMLRRQLVELDTRRTDTILGAYAIRITSAGRYYLEYFVNAFAYLDLVWHDTPFSVRGTSDGLAKLMHSVELEERFKRVDLFLDYLERQENIELGEFAALRESKVFGPFIPRIRAIYMKERMDIERRLSKAIVKDQRPLNHLRDHLSRTNH